MKRRKRIGISLIVASLLVGALSWSASRVIRQEQRNRQLITAIKQSDYGHSQAAKVRACLERGADPNAYDVPYRTDLSWDRLLTVFGVRKSHADSTQNALFLALEGEMNDTTYSFMHFPDPAIVKILLQHGADIRSKDRYGRLPLAAAFKLIVYPPHAGGSSPPINLECEQCLIEAGADVEARDQDGYTALMTDSRLAALLLRKGANVNAAMKDGTTALICHAMNGDESVCRFLLDHGADVNASQGGRTALYFAAQGGDAAIVGMLLKHGAAVDGKGIHVQTALMTAAEGGHCAIVQTLLQHGAAIDAQDMEGWTPLLYAARQGNETCVRQLLGRGASVTLKGKDGETLAQMVKDPGTKGNRAVMRLLKQYGMTE